MSLWRSVGVSPASLLVTATAAAVVGVGSVVLGPSDRAIPRPVTIAGAVVVDDQGLSLALRPVAPLQSLGEPIMLDLFVHNRGEGTVPLPPDLTFELSVRHEQVGASGAAADVESALLVLDVVLGEHATLGPGQSYVQRVALAPGPPFERPGRYLMTAQREVATDGDTPSSAMRLLLCDTIAGSCEAGEA